MEEVLEESIADVLRRSQEENKPVKIQKEISGELRRVMGDFDRVRQILDNLLDNAYHYSPPEGRITVRMQPAGEALQVDVIDTGMGIPVEEQHRIFERFFRGEGPLLMGVSGTGLGLSIVQNLVQMHHGRIWFESAGVPGLGSTFSFTLPVYEAQPEGDESRIILESGGADASASE
jgi:signal transduction histidine kinase